MGLKVGIQLFSVRNAMQADPVKAIGDVAAMGYRYVEAANHHATTDYGVGFPADPDTLLAQLEKHGSRFLNAHVFPLTMENAAPVIAWHKRAGTPYLTNPCVFFKDLDDVLSWCREFNAVGAACRAEGIRFCYHNHFHEFVKVDGEKTVMDVIVENTDPELVGIELDTYWALRGGADPVALIRKWKGRVPLLHQKDLIKDLKEPVNILELVPPGEPIDMAMFQKVFNRETVVEIGTGCMDIQAIIDAANEVGGVEAIILEQDNTKFDEMESIAISMREFRKFTGIEW